MIDHIDFAVRDLAVSRPFYTAVLAALGWSVVVEFDEEGRRGVGFGMGAIGHLFIGAGQPVGGRMHFALPAKSRAEVEAFYAAALAAGGVHHGFPGLRPRYGETYYAAFVRDPDGHVIEAVFRG
jgi:catechol 2,3-dioxygenase-like lactoylglutathione lyase family enzyme